MDKYRELLFLKELNGVGPVRINKFYVPVLLKGTGLDDLISIVKSNLKFLLSTVDSTKSY